MTGLAALLVIASWELAADSRADDTTAIVSSQRPVRIEVVTVGRGPARAEMERAVRELVGALPELSWTDGAAVPSDEMSQVPRVLIDVTDRTRVRIVATRARDSTLPPPATLPPVVREVVTEGLSAEVARETVAQIVRTTVRALLDPAGEPGDGATASRLEPPPLSPLSLPSPPAPIAAAGAIKLPRTATVTRAPISAPRHGAHPYSAVISVGHRSFSYDATQPLAVQAKVNSVALSFDRRYGMLSATARLSGEWSRDPVAEVVVATQILTSSAGVSANLDVGRVSLALGLEAGAVVIRQDTSLADWADQSAWRALGLPGVLRTGWSAGPMVGLRSSMSVDLFSHAFVRLEAAVPVTWLDTRDVNGDSAWRVGRYAQVMLGVGYRL